MVKSPPLPLGQQLARIFAVASITSPASMSRLLDVCPRWRLPGLGTLSPAISLRTMSALEHKRRESRGAWPPVCQQ